MLEGEMKLWQRAAGALKDQNSIWAATLSRKSSYRNPNLESAVIKATSHDELHVDYRNAQRVFAWIRTTPSSLKPLLWTLSKRMQKTKSWVVALKGLILMHGVLCCKIPAVQNIGRLPFDLSSFRDGHTRPSSSWGFNNFIHAYYAFLDHRSSFLFEQRSKRNEPEPPQLVHEILKLQKWQSLLDLLLQIKPQTKNMRVVLILEAIDCLVIEIYDLYSRICSGVARVLLGIYSAEKPEVEMALKVLQKATQQGEELSLYFKFCREFGVTNTTEIPKAYQIPVEDIEDLKRFIEGFSRENEEEEDTERKYENTESKGFSAINVAVEEKATVPVTDQDEDKLNNKALMTTIITDKWEVFDQQGNEGINNNNHHHHNQTSETSNNPFLDSTSILPLVSEPVPAYQNDLPDLICF